MMHRFRALFFVFLFLTATSASAAINVDGQAGLSFGSGDASSGVSNPSFLLGGDAMLGIGDLIQVGGFYDHNFLYPQGGGNSTGLNFYGAIARMGLPYSLFVDGKIGLTDRGGSDKALGLGAGVGFRIPVVPGIEVMPRGGYRYLPYKISGTTLTQHMWDLGVLVGIAF